MMIEATLGTFGVCLAVLLVWSYTIKATLSAHTAAMVQAITALENLQELAQAMAEQSPTDEMLDVLADSLSQMHVPTGQDHMQAAMATGLNMLFAKILGGGGPIGGLLGGMPANVPDSGTFEQPPQG